MTRGVKKILCTECEFLVLTLIACNIQGVSRRRAGLRAGTWLTDNSAGGVGRGKSSKLSCPWFWLRLKS